MTSIPPPYLNFVNRLCVPHFQHGKVVTLLYDECLTAVRHKLNEVQTCCLTTECWITEKTHT